MSREISGGDRECFKSRNDIGTVQDRLTLDFIAVTTWKYSPNFRINLAVLGKIYIGCLKRFLENLEACGIDRNEWRNVYRGFEDKLYFTCWLNKWGEIIFFDIYSNILNGV